MPAARDGALEYYTYINTEQFKKDIREMIQGVDRVGDKTEKETKRMDEAFKKLSTAVAGYFTFQAAKGFVTKLVQIRGEFQQLNIALETMLGNKEKADALMEQIKQLAATTPFQLTDVAAGAKQLLAYGFAADTVVGTIKQLGDLAAGVSAPLGDIVYLYGTLKAQGRAYTQDIRQFTNRGIPILQELVKVLGVDSVAAVNKMVTAGKVGFPEVKKALDAMTGSGGQFFNLMAKQSKSLTGQISNLQDQFEFMLNDLGKSSEGFISGGIELASELIAHYEEILKTVGTIAAAYGVYRAALIATIAIERIQQSVSLEMAAAQGTLNASQAAGIIVMGNLRKAWKFLTLAIEANPIGAVVAAVTALYLGFEALMPELLTAKEAITQISSAQENFTEQANKANGINDLLDKYSKLTEEAKAGKDVQDELNDVMVKLSDSVPGTALVFGEFGKVIGVNTQKIKDYSTNLKEMSITQLEAIRTTTQEVLARYQQMAKPFQETLNKGQAQRGLNLFGNFIPLYTIDAEASDISYAQDQLKTLNPKIKTLKERLKQTRELISRLGYGIDTRSQSEKQKETFEELLKDVSSNFKKMVGLAQNKDDLGKIKKGLQAKLDALAPSDAQTSELKEKILRVNKILESYKIGKGGKGIEVPIKPVIPDISSFLKELQNKIKSDLGKTKPLDLNGITDQLFGSVNDNWKDFFKSLSDNFDSSVGELKGKLKEIQNVLKSGVFKDGLGRIIEITPAQRKGLESAAKSIKELLGITDSKGKEIKDVFGELGDVFSKLSENTDEVSSGLSGILGLLSSSAIAASSIKKGIEGVKDVIDIIKKGGGLKDVFSGGLSGLAGIATGIGAAISVVSSIVSAINKKQAEADRKRAKAIEKENDLLQHQYDLTKKIYGIEQIKAQMDIVKKAQEDRNKKAEELLNLFQDWNMAFGGTFSTDQTKEWEKSIKNAIDTKDWDKLSLIVDDIQTGALNWSESAKASFNAIKNDIELIQEATNQIRESFTGISLDSLTDEIVSMFGEGKIAAADLADTFEDLMKKSITETFKRKYLATQLQGWYKQFADFANPENGDGTLTEGEVSQLRDNLNVIIANAKTGWEQLQKAAGLDFSDVTGGTEESSGLTNQIKKSITEDTATELSGRINGMYLMAKKSSDNVAALLTVQKSWQQKQMQQLSLSIRHLAGIESNTLKTANNSVYLSYLKSIDGKLSNGNDAKRAGGVK